MRSLIDPIILLLLCLPLIGQAQVQEDEAQRDALSLKVLQAVDYVQLQRSTLRRECKKPGVPQRVPACNKIAEVPNSAIERMMLPHFNRHVPSVQAQAALDFWTSQKGAVINKKLVREVDQFGTAQLTDEDLRLLGQFNRSSAGQAMTRLAEDRSVTPDVMRAIGEYKP